MNINTVDLNRPQRFSQFTNMAHYNMQFAGQKKEASPNVKAGAALSSLIGTGTVLTLIAKKQGFPINPKILKNIPLKDWAFFKIAKKANPTENYWKLKKKKSFHWLQDP